VLLHFKRSDIQLKLTDLDDFVNHIKFTQQLNSEEQYVVNFVLQLKNGSTHFSFKTSGSTGIPKEITLSRDQLFTSAANTLNFLAITSPIHVLLAINPTFIGGTMQIVRTYLLDGHLDIVPAQAVADLHNAHYDLTSLVPIQIAKIYEKAPHLLDQLGHILVGGALIDPTLEQMLLADRRINPSIFATYGMTETASHIALRKLGQPYFNTIGDTEIGFNEAYCLKIKSKVTQEAWLQTSDIVEIIAPTQFIWLGRHDFVINTGGIKIPPEKIEALLKTQVSQNLMLTSLPDELLGQRVVLLVEGNSIPKIDFSSLSSYERPKAIYHLIDFSYTPSGKLDRRKTQQRFIESQ
jgi:o-succinylbenzoate---CoA ligase